MTAATPTRRRRGLRRTIRRAFFRLLTGDPLRLGLVTTVAVLLLAVFAYVAENWRGAWAWNAAKKRLQEKGVPVTIESLIPPEIPADENFAALPFWQDQFAYVRSDDGNIQRQKPNSRTDFFPTRRGSSLPDFTTWQAGKEYDLAQCWVAIGADADTSDPNLSYEQEQQLLKKVSSLERAELGRRIHTHLTELKAPYVKLKQAATERPSARFPLHYEENFNTLLPHLSELKQLAQAASVRASALLAQQKPNEAIDDVLFGLYLVNTLEGEPLLISELVRIAMFHITIQPVWEGLMQDQWSQAHIKQIEAKIASFNFLNSFRRSLAGDFVFGIDLTDILKNKRSLKMLSAPYTATESPWISHLLRWAPGGWYDQNKARLARHFEGTALQVIDVEANRVYPTKSDQTFDPSHSFFPYSFIVREIAPSLSNGAQRSAHAENTQRQLRIACAIERFEIDHKRLPQTLDQLVPQYASSLPTDTITGKPFHFRRPNQGTYLLYSIGWDQTDHGGQYNEDEPSKSDWVWFGS